MPTTYQAQFDSGDPSMVDYTPGSAVTAGTVVVQGSVPMVAHADLDANAKGALADGGGVYICDCNAAIAAGDALWWDDTNNRVTETASGNTHFGHAAAASYSSDTLVLARHDPQGVTGAIV